jgi:hypothetical protein
MSLKTRITRLEHSANRQGNDQSCQRHEIPVLGWENESPEEFAARLVSGCPNCGQPYLGDDALCNEIGDVLNKVYGGRAA